MAVAVPHVGEQHHVAVRDVADQVRARPRGGCVIRVQRVAPALVEIDQERRLRVRARPSGTSMIARSGRPSAERYVTRCSLPQRYFACCGFASVTRAASRKDCRSRRGRESPERRFGEDRAVAVLRDERRLDALVERVEDVARNLVHLRVGAQQLLRRPAVRRDARVAARQRPFIEQREQDRLAGRERVEVRVGAGARCRRSARGVPRRG